MKVYDSIADLSAIDGSLHVAIGVFDGVHLGHQAVIESAQKSALAAGGAACVLTFDPHPVRVLAPTYAPRLLTSTEHKLRLLNDMGIGHVGILRFDRAFAETSAEDFVRQLNESAQNLERISVGAEWRFGHGGAGDLDLLAKLGTELDFDVTGVSTIKIEGMTASSTRVREAIASGDFAVADRLLGRPYTVLGTVIEGRKLGRELGFPTANLTVHSEQLPPTGVYAVSVRKNGESLPGVANLGYRPSIEGSASKRLLEVHLLDWQGDLYGQNLEVRFLEFVRPEKKFDDLNALKAQIAEDASKVRELIAENAFES